MAKKESYNKEVVILVGPPGSGKSTLCGNRFASYTRISQDEMGKENHYNEFLEALKTQRKVIVDRINHKRNQRSRYIEPAMQKGFTVRIIKLNESYDVCLARLLDRKDHPSIHHEDENFEEIARGALGGFFFEYEDVLPEETHANRKVRKSCLENGEPAKSRNRPPK